VRDGGEGECKTHEGRDRGRGAEGVMRACMCVCVNTQVYTYDEAFFLRRANIWCLLCFQHKLHTS
jgi:hypothetical protein